MHKMKISIPLLRLRERKTLLVGWIVQARAAKNFINANAVRVPVKEQDAWKVEVWENATCGIIYQLFRQDDLRYLVGRLAHMGAYRRSIGGRTPEGDAEG